MLSSLRKVEFSRNGATNRHRISSKKQIIFPCLRIGELNPRADCTKIVLDHSQTLAVANDVVVAGHKVKAHVILLATVDSEASHHHTITPSLSANIDCLSVSSFIRIVRLVYVGLTDRDIGINVGSVHPFSAKVLW